MPENATVGNLINAVITHTLDRQAHRLHREYDVFNDICGFLNVLKAKRQQVLCKEGEEMWGKLRNV